MVDHLLDAFTPFVSAVVVVAHPLFATRMREHLASRAELPWTVVEQARPTGMLDAILIGARAAEVEHADRAWIVWCDQVAVLVSTLTRLADTERRDPADVIFPTVSGSAPYIHFPRDAEGRIVEVLQRREGDVMPEYGESDMGVFSLSAAALRKELPAFDRATTSGAGTGERNFLPFIPWLARRSRVLTVPCTDPREAVGINTPEELASVESWLRERATHA